ncbi:MAG: symporter small accessory protein [Campylobacterota bacterium]
MEHFDFGVALAFWLSIVSAIACVIYGAMYWNKEDRENIKELKKWAKDEDKIERQL